MTDFDIAYGCGDYPTNECATKAEPKDYALKVELERFLQECGVTAEYVNKDFLPSIACHFAKWGRKQVLTAKPSEELEEEIHRYFKELEKSDCISNTRRLAKHFTEWQKQKMEKEAVEGQIEGDWREQEDAPYELYATSDELTSTKYKIGDKIKLIILKENEL